MDRNAKTAARVAVELAESHRELANGVREAAKGMEIVRESIEGVYLSKGERLRLAAAIAGIPSAAATLAAGAPLYVVTPRIAGSLLTLMRAGARIRATRETYMSLREVLDEINSIAY
ncbi:MAG TPA: hypothetical protein EYH50_01810 [Pyrodictium delaneyi]|uniref:Uncharacterized protein n=1 Tax=Pyrodictium delaneyi TaxID=1273541 RepID=A0A832ZT82_9CREN|nr:hypothetical protein [Pyrodictium delaneyi]